MEIESLVLDESAIKGCKIFRPKEFGIMIIVDESVKQSIENFDITNTILVPVEEYDSDNYWSHVPHSWVTYLVKGTESRISYSLGVK